MKLSVQAHMKILELGIEYDMPTGTLHLSTIPSEGCGGYQVVLSFQEMDPLGNRMVETSFDNIVMIAEDSYDLLKDVEIDYNSEDEFIINNPNAPRCQCENGGSCYNK